MNYLITGGAGNLACQLSHLLVNRGGQVTLMDIAEQPSSEPAAAARYVRADLTSPDDLNNVFTDHQPDVVLHFASLLSGSSEQSRPLAWRVNVDGTFGLFEAALVHQVKSVFIPSSVASYGRPVPPRVDDMCPQWPHGLYGVTKVLAERLGVYYHETHGLDFRCLRLPIVISAHSPSGAASDFASRAFIGAARNGRVSLKVRPETRASLVYIKDALNAIVQLVDAPAEQLTQRVYNIQSIATTAGQIVEAIRHCLPDAELQFEPDLSVVELVESWPGCLDDSTARCDWQWRPTFDLEHIAKDFIQELRRGDGDSFAI